MNRQPPRSSDAGISIRREAGFASQMPLDKRAMLAVLAAMRIACGVPNALELVLTNDARIADANKTFMGCIGPTNILSFPALPAENRYAPTAACLLLSLDTLEREAFLYGQDTTEHSLRLLAHGMAHIAGHDHGPRMASVEKTALEAGLRALATLHCKAVRKSNA